MIRTCSCGATFVPTSEWQHECDECERWHDHKIEARLEAMEEADQGEDEMDWEAQEIELDEAA